MITFNKLIVRIGILTIVFVVIFIISITATTIIFQNDVHPDFWMTTKYDIIAMVLSLAGYLFSTGFQVSKYIILKKRTKKGITIETSLK